MYLILIKEIFEPALYKHQQQSLFSLHTNCCMCRLCSACRRSPIVVCQTFVEMRKNIVFGLFIVLNMTEKKYEYNSCIIYVSGQTKKNNTTSFEYLTLLGRL